MGRGRTFLRFYKGAALVLLNSIVVLAAVNAGLYLIFQVKDAYTLRQAEKTVARIHENPSLTTVYPGMDAQSIDQLIRETWSRPYVYEPFTQFKERPFQGRFVNVSEAGYRLSKNQGPWPPDTRCYNIFLFGGSTAFGYGVPDDQTIASYLQQRLPNVGARAVRVYNFGRSSYVSRQERVLLEELLIAGHVPDMAIFIDGLNEFAFPEGPAETARLEAVFGKRRNALTRWPALDALPMTRLAHYFRRAISGALGKQTGVLPQNVQPTAAFDDGRYHDSAVITAVIDRYLSNKKLTEAAARSCGTSAVFVWQPIPLYKYDLQYHLFATGDFGSNYFARYGYDYMATRVDERPPGPNFLWCADMQDSLEEPLYVDKVHYTAAMSDRVATAIRDGLIERDLLAGPPRARRDGRGDAAHARIERDD